MTSVDPRPTDVPEGAGDVIAIDGQSGSGKSTLARALARRLGWRYLDTGAMYRAVALAALRHGVAPDDAVELARLVGEVRLEPGLDPTDPRILLDGRDATSAVRSAEVTAAVSAVAAVPLVRTVLTAQQRAIASSGAIVVEGRDIGSVVFPTARLKVWLTVDPDEAGRRRARDEGQSPADQARALVARDQADASRIAAPAQAAPDAMRLDSSTASVEELVEILVGRLCQTRGFAGGHAPEGRPLVRKAVRTHPAAIAFARWIGRSLVVPLFDVRVSGVDHVPPAGPVLLVGNHVSALDGPFLYAVSPRPARFLVKAEAYRPPLSRLLAAIDQWPVSRGRADREALVAARAQLRAGGVVALFPEGTRGDGSVARVHDGTGWLLAHVPTAVVVPVAFRRGAARRGALVDFGGPLSVTPAARRDRAAFRALAAQVATGLAAHVAGASSPTRVAT